MKYSTLINRQLKSWNMNEFLLMDRDNKGKMINILSAFFLSLYIFCAHFNYPFSSTYFLYGGFVAAVIAILKKRRLKTSKPLIIYIIIIVFTFMGIIYSTNVEQGERQAVFFLVYFFFYWLAMQDGCFLRIIKKTTYCFAFLGMISVYIQLLFQLPFNLLLSKILRPDIYEGVMWSYNVDGTFTGLTQSVSMASFSMAIVFFEAMQNALNLHFKRVANQRFRLMRVHPVAVKMLNYSVAAIALFGIILTSKRGIFLACILALTITLVMDKDITFRYITKSQFTVGLIIILITLTVGMYFISTNDYITAFANRFSGANITTGRDEFYRNAMSEFSQGTIFNYLFGKGTGSAFLVNSTGLHNVYLQILYDHGIFGIILYGLFFFLNVKNAIINGYFYSMCVQIMFMAYCMTGNPLYDYYFFIPYLIYSCDKS